jgi:hypothetical protein
MNVKVRKWVILLASTVFLFGTLTPAAMAITENKAEGLANAQTSMDCHSYWLWHCEHEDLSECQLGDINAYGHVEWWCTEIFILHRKLLGPKERICHRVLGYSPKGKLLSKPKISCQPVEALRFRG